MKKTDACISELYILNLSYKIKQQKYYINN